MCVTICGRFCSDEGVVAGYDNRIRTKYTAKWGVQIAGMIFQTRSRNRVNSNYRIILFFKDYRYVICYFFVMFRPVYPAAFVKLFDIRQFHCCEYRFIPMEAFYVSIYSIVDRMGE